VVFDVLDLTLQARVKITPYQNENKAMLKFCKKKATFKCSFLTAQNPALLSYSK
jgi:hypothetical protein